MSKTCKTLVSLSKIDEVQQLSESFAFIEAWNHRTPKERIFAYFEFDNLEIEAEIICLDLNGWVLLKHLNRLHRISSRFIVGFYTK
jgi:hypothetical protein